MNIKKLLKANNITARVLTRWSNPRCKFQYGEWVKPKGKLQIPGEVIAVSTADGKHIRAENRGHTRYFVKFSDGGVRGYYSNCLVVA